MQIKGLQEQLGVTDEQIEHLKKLRIQAEMQQAMLMMTIWKRGGNIHGVNETATRKRRAKNKAARKARKANRVR